MIIRLRSDDIIETIHIEGWKGPETLEHAKENVAAVQRISAGNDYCLLGHLTDERVSDEAQIFYSEQKSAVFAIALVTKNMIQALLGNIFMSVRKLQAPTKLFSNPDDATAWLYEKRKDLENQKKFTQAG